MSDSLVPLTLSPEDFNDLRTAFQQSDPRVQCYLDPETGEVLWYSNRPMDVDQESEPDDSDRSPDDPRRRRASGRRDEGRLLDIPPNDELETWQDMTTFLEEEASERLRTQCQDRSADRSTFRRFEDILDRHPEQRRRWLAFHRRRLRERIEEWLRLNGYALDVEDETSGSRP